MKASYFSLKEQMELDPLLKEMGYTAETKTTAIPDEETKEITLMSLVYLTHNLPEHKINRIICQYDPNKSMYSVTWRDITRNLAWFRFIEEQAKKHNDSADAYVKREKRAMVNELLEASRRYMGQLEKIPLAD